jgi:dipeptidyl aminopeptidase/acylaminoacyl peptidase
MRLRCALLCFCLAAAQMAGHAADQRIPLSSFILEDQFSNPKLSPDGRYIAITARIPAGQRFIPVVTVYSLPDLKIVGGIRMPVFDVPLNYIWVSKTRLAIAKGRELGSREKPVATGEVLAAEFDGGKQEYLYGYEMFKASRRGDRYGDDHGYGSIQDLPRERNGHFYLASHAWEGTHSMLYDIDSVSAVRKLLADLPLPDLDFVMQRNGMPRFSHGTGEDSYAVLFRYNDKTDGWDKLTDKLGRRYVPIAFSADDSEFMVSHSADGGPDKLVRENFASGARVTLFEDPDGSVDTYMFGAQRGLPFAASASIGIPRIRYVDEGSAETTLHKALSQQFPGSFVSFINFTEDGKQLLFSVASDRDPGAYYLYNRTTNKADLLFTSMQDIDPDEMAERRPVSFKARDGLWLHGYLTMPKHAANARLPMVLIPHGGPHGSSKDSWFFDQDAQFLASRGYAVVQVNFRGSGGRGVNFEHAGYRQWGAKIQDDLVDGVRWAVAQGEVDASRVCAYGASFGGYSALMLAAREPAMFKCAVGYAGIYDLNLLYKQDATQRNKLVFNVIKKYIGQDKDELNRFSPALLASQITVPVLLVHGEKDKRAPFEHAEAMRAALVKVNRPPEWFTAPNEGHGFYDTRNVTAFYEKLEAFLDKHIGNGLTK